MSEVLLSTGDDADIGHVAGHSLQLSSDTQRGVEECLIRIVAGDILRHVAT